MHIKLATLVMVGCMQSGVMRRTHAPANQHAYALALAWFAVAISRAAALGGGGFSGGSSGGYSGGSSGGGYSGGAYATRGIGGGGGGGGSGGENIGLILGVTFGILGLVIIFLFVGNAMQQSESDQAGVNKSNATRVYSPSEVGAKAVQSAKTGWRQYLQSTDTAGFNRLPVHKHMRAQLWHAHASGLQCVRLSDMICTTVSAQEAFHAAARLGQ